MDRVIGCTCGAGQSSPHLRGCTAVSAPVGMTGPVAQRTTTQARINSVLLATRAADRAQARKREAPASKVVVALANDVIALAEMVEILCGALAEAEFGRR